jgi:DNA-directed RNA polymerase subunit N (RpoN/RPB10)
MLLPVRCFTCNKPLSNEWKKFRKTINSGMFSTKEKLLTDLGLKRYCCRRLVITYEPLIDRLLEYEKKTAPPTEI